MNKWQWIVITIIAIVISGKIYAYFVIKNFSLTISLLRGLSFLIVGILLVYILRDRKK